MIASQAYDTEAIKSRVDCRDLMRRFYPHHFKRSKSRYDVYYAFNRDDNKKPALRIYADGVKDFGGSGESWNVFQLTANALNLDIKNDFPKICEYLTSGNIPLSDTPRPEREHNPSEPPSAAWQAAIMPYIDQWELNLWESPQMVDYLRTKRGLSDETIRQFRIGYNPSWADMRCNGDVLKVAPGITIAWFADGQLYAVRVRTFDDYLDKYMSVTGSKPSSGLFNADSITSGQDVLIVEGEFDCMLAAQNGVTAVTRGSAGDHRNITDKWLNRLKSASSVYGLLDNDKAGQEATEALFQQLENFIPLPLPEGKDLTDYVLSGGQVVDILQRTELATIAADMRRNPVHSEPHTGSDTPLLPGAAYDMPIGELTALLNTFHKGSTALVYAELRALHRIGKIGDYLDTSMMIELTDFDPKTVYKALSEIAEFTDILTPLTQDEIVSIKTFFQDVGVGSYSKPLPSQLGKNSTSGRMATLYRVDFSHEQAALTDAAHRVSIPHYHKSTLATLTGRMVLAAGGNASEYKTAKEVIQAAQSNQDREVQNELSVLWAGNGDDWIGLHALMESGFTVDSSGLHSLRELRVRAYTTFLKSIGNTQRRTVLCYLLGCSDTELSHVIQKANYRTVAQYQECEINSQNLDNEIIHLNRTLKGKVTDFRIEFKTGSDVYCNIFKDKQWREKISDYAPEADRVIAIVRVASLHVPLTEDEIKAQQEAEKEAETDNEQVETVAESAITPDENSVTDEPPQEQQGREIDPIMSDENPVFIRRQFLMVIDRLNPYTVADGQVLRDGQVIAAPDCDLRTLLEIVLQATVDDIRKPLPQVTPQADKVEAYSVEYDNNTYSQWKAQSANIPF